MANIIDRNIFERKVEQLLKNKSVSFKENIHNKINRYIEYASIIKEELPSLEVVISWVVELDIHYEEY